MNLAEIRDYLSYDPDTGMFRWIKLPGIRTNVKIGDIAGGTFGAGYWKIVFRGRNYYAHRLAWWFVHGEMPPEIDHRNSQKDDNRIKNLRLATRSQNKCNCGIHPNNKSGYRGVSYCKRDRRWTGEVSAGGRRVWRGNFLTAEAAARARDAAAIKHQGQFVWLNFPQS